MLNLAMNLARSAAVFPDHPAVVAEGAMWTYAELEVRAAQAAGVFRARGVAPGDRVALACTNRPEFVQAYYGILKCGAVVVPLDPRLRYAELAVVLRQADVAVLVCERSPNVPGLFGEARRAWRDADLPPGGCVAIGLPEPDACPTLDELAAGMPRQFECHPTGETDTAAILFTSGTTGTPRGAELSHSNLALNAAYTALMQKADTRDALLAVLPLSHAFGQTLLMNVAVLCGATLRLLPRFEPAQVLEILTRERISIFAGVPTMYVAMIKMLEARAETHVASALRLGISGGSALSMPLHEAFERIFGVTLLEGYGLSETSPLAVFSFPDTEHAAGCVGYPLYGTEARLVDAAGHPAAPGTPGELELRGHHVMKGYFRNARDTAAAMHNSWFVTGDIAALQAAGGLKLVDRKKDVIIRGGYTLYPQEIESLLLTHPDIDQAVVVGVPDALFGQDVKAFVVPRKPDLTADTVMRWARERMASYKYPRNVEIVSDLPRNSLGKIQRYRLLKP